MPQVLTRIIIMCFVNRGRHYFQQRPPFLPHLPSRWDSSVSPLPSSYLFRYHNYHFILLNVISSPSSSYDPHQNYNILQASPITDIPTSSPNSPKSTAVQVDLHPDIIFTIVITASYNFVCSFTSQRTQKPGRWRRGRTWWSWSSPSSPSPAP